MPDYKLSFSSKRCEVASACMKSSSFTLVLVHFYSRAVLKRILADKMTNRRKVERNIKLYKLLVSKEKEAFSPSFGPHIFSGASRVTPRLISLLWRTASFHLTTDLQ